MHFAMEEVKAAADDERNWAQQEQEEGLKGKQGRQRLQGAIHSSDNIYPEPTVCHTLFVCLFLSQDIIILTIIL